MRTISILQDSLYTRGKFDYHPREEKVEDLRRKNITVVVNLTTRADPDLVDVDGLEYVHYSMSDGQEVDVETVWVLAKKLAERIRQGRKVLVHCNAGRNRAALVAAATVALVEDISGAEAVDLVQRRRKGAFGTNPNFEEYMREDFDDDRELERTVRVG